MDSVKSIVVVAILLGVLYGIYQVINDDDSPVSPTTTNLMDEFDKGDDSSIDGDEIESDLAADASSSRPRALVKTDADTSKVPLKPPPSTFSAKSSQFAFPEKQKDSTPKAPPSNAPVSSEARPSGSFALQQNPGKENGNSVDAKPSSIDSSITKTDSQAFKEIGTVKKSEGIDNTGIYQSGTGDSSQIAPATLEASLNDPRSRFIQGSFAEFEKQVVGDMSKAEQLIRNNDFVAALKLLTKFYDDPRLTKEENQNLASWLDPLAGKVIYSSESHLNETYFVRQNDSLNVLSAKFNVPAELIYNINRASIPDSQKLVPGTELKMVRGPFNAEISLAKKKMTLFVQGLYAGTFQIRIGNEPFPKKGKYRVLSKSRLGQIYTDQQSLQRIDAAAPENPYGKHYLNIGGGMAIHGSAQVSDSNDQRGCISMNAIDAEDVHNILTTKSTIVIVD